MDKEIPLGLSIVIPIYNEVGNIEKLVDKINLFSKNFIYDHEFILVDGNSNDGTVNKLQKIQNNKNIKILYQTKKIGYGFDILKGLEISKYKYIGWTHADLQTDINDLTEAYYKIKDKENVIIKGKRKNRKLIENFFTFGMEILVLLLLKKRLNDINAQPKVFSRLFFNKINKQLWPNDFSLDLFILLNSLSHCIEILNIDVYFFDRKDGVSKGGTGFYTRIKLIYRTIKYIYRVSKLKI